MAKFKPYVPPMAMPKTIRKGMTMDKFPLSAWPIFSRQVLFIGRTDRYSRQPTTQVEETKPYTAAQRRKEIEKANDYIEDNLDYMKEDDDYLTWEGWAEQKGILPEVFVIVWNNQPALRKRGGGVVFLFEVAKVTKVTTPRKLTEIMWSTYAGYDVWVQIISGRSTLSLVYDHEQIGDYDYLSAIDVRDLDLLIEYMRGPYGFIPWDDKGRAYIQFDGHHGDYTATVRSISQLHDFLEGESDDHTEAKIIEVTEDSPFNSDNLAIALLMHGIEVE